MVGQITVNWAAADHILGRVLEDVIYHLGEGEAAREVGADLIHGINMRRKLDLIKRHRRRLPDENEIDTIMSELKSACEKEKVFRNMLAHGILLFDPDGNGVFYSPTKKEPMAVTELPRAVEFSRYAARLSKRLWVWSHGAVPPDPWPEKP